MPPWGRLVPHNPRHRCEDTHDGTWPLWKNRIAVGRGVGCNIVANWFSGSQHQFDLEYDPLDGTVYVTHQTRVGRTFLNGGGPEGKPLPEGRPFKVYNEAGNAPHQPAGVPADAPLLFCDVPNRHFAQRIQAKRRNPATGGMEVCRPFAEEHAVLVERVLTWADSRALGRPDGHCGI